MLEGNHSRRSVPALPNTRKTLARAGCCEDAAPCYEMCEELPNIKSIWQKLLKEELFLDIKQQNRNLFPIFASVSD